MKLKAKGDCVQKAARDMRDSDSSRGSLYLLLPIAQNSATVKLRSKYLKLFFRGDISSDEQTSSAHGKVD